MIYSMTGWGKTTSELKGKKITIEIRSLNSKQLDLSIRMPTLYREKELEIRNLIAGKLLRGKVDLSISAELIEKAAVASINGEVLKKYYEQVKEITSSMGLDIREDILPALLRMPDILATGTEEAPEEEWAILMDALKLAIDQVIRYRASEGSVLEEDFRKRIRLIEEMIPEVEAFEEPRIQKIRERIQNSLLELNGSLKIDPNRFEQEIIYYLEKIDITEEKLRLRNNCNYFYEVCGESGTAGKKLGFVTQEIGREINTLGSKANDSDIQRVVVRMKDELEKVKEQLMNVL